MYLSEVVGHLDRKRLGARLGDDLEGTQVSGSELARRLSRLDMFGVDVRVFADLEVGRRFSSGVGSIGIPLLSTSELFLEHFLNFEDVDSEIASEN